MFGTPPGRDMRMVKQGAGPPFDRGGVGDVDDAADTRARSAAISLAGESVSASAAAGPLAQTEAAVIIDTGMS